MALAMALAVASCRRAAVTVAETRLDNDVRRLVAPQRDVRAAEAVLDGIVQRGLLDDADMRA
jgi:hypothetical protein